MPRRSLFSRLLLRVAVSPSAIQAVESQNCPSDADRCPTKPTGQNLFLGRRNHHARDFSNLVSVRYLIFRIVAHLLTKIRCTFTYTRGKNLCKYRQAVVTALHLCRRNAFDVLIYRSENMMGFPLENRRKPRLATFSRISAIRLLRLLSQKQLMPPQPILCAW